MKASMFYALDVLHSLKRFYHRKTECDVLILVRYLMGTAYLPSHLAKIGYGFFVKFVPTSPYMFFLDALPEELAARIIKRTEVEMFETFEEFVKVRKKALTLAEGWHIIDASGSVEETFALIECVLDQLDAQET
jgi:dTMP kinase